MLLLNACAFVCVCVSEGGGRRFKTLVNEHLAVVESVTQETHRCPAGPETASAPQLTGSNGVSGGGEEFFLM